jgi:hypothetical protein
MATEGKIGEERMLSLFSTHLCLCHVELPSGVGGGEGAVAEYSEQKRLPQQGAKEGLASPASRRTPYGGRGAGDAEGFGLLVRAESTQMGCAGLLF